MVINHNMSSLFASRMEGITTGSLQKSKEEKPLAEEEKVERSIDLLEE